MTGTGSESEKRILFAICKVIEPLTSADLGTMWGAMATQMVTARSLIARIYTVDIGETIQGTKHKTGKFIPEDEPIIYVYNGAVEFLATKEDDYFDFIFEDTAHSAEVTHLIYEQAKKKLRPGGVIMSHDVCIQRWRDNIAEGFRMADVSPELYLVDGDACGLSIWQKPFEVYQGIDVKEGFVEPVIITFDPEIQVEVNTWEETETDTMLGDPTSSYMKKRQEEAKMIDKILEPEEPVKPKRKRRSKKKKTIEDQ